MSDLRPFLAAFFIGGLATILPQSSFATPLTSFGAGLQKSEALANPVETVGYRRYYRHLRRHYYRHRYFRHHYRYGHYRYYRYGGYPYYGYPAYGYGAPFLGFGLTFGGYGDGRAGRDN